MADEQETETMSDPNAAVVDELDIVDPVVAAMDAEAAEAEKKKPDAEAVAPEEDATDTGTDDSSETAGDDDQAAGVDEDAEGQAEEDKDSDDTPEPLPDELVDRAEAAGMTLEDVVAIGSADALERVLALRERWAGNGKSAPAKGKGKEQEQQEDAGEKIDIPDLPEDVAEPEVREAWGKLKALTLKQHERLTQLEARDQERTQADQRRAAESFYRDHDAWVQKLDSGLKDRYGDGPIEKLAPNSKERKARDSLLQRMNTLARGYQAVGQKPPTLDRLREEALLLDAGRTLATQERIRLSDRLKQKRGQRLLPPGTRGKQKRITSAMGEDVSDLPE